MFDRKETACLNCSRKFMLLMLFVAIACSVPAGAQKKLLPNSGPKYELQTEAKIKGAVDDIRLPPKGSEKLIVHLTVKDAANSIDAYLCPKSFLDDMGMSFAKGDEITMTGSKVKQGDADVFLVREIVTKGTDTFSLRDAKGEPVWDWRH